MRQILLASLLIVPLRASAADPAPFDPIVVVDVRATSTLDAKSEAARAVVDRMWCSAPGKSVGETITVSFDRPTPISNVVFVGGVARSPRVVEVVRDGAPAGRFAAKTGAHSIDLSLDGAATTQLALRIVETEPGAHWKPSETHTCLSSLRLRTATPRPFVVGSDRKTAVLLASQARALAAALERCDEAILRDSVVFPLQRRIMVMGAGGPDEEFGYVESYLDATALARACRRPTNLLGFDGSIDDGLADVKVVPPGPTAEVAFRNTRWPMRFSAGRWRLTAMEATFNTDDAGAAKTANTEGMKLYRQKRFAAAGEKFTLAIVADPINWVARYNLACVDSLLGDIDGAIDQLSWIDRATAVPVSIAQTKLTKAKSDPDLERVRADPRARKILGLP